jgi:hypothetical protein
VVEGLTSCDNLRAALAIAHESLSKVFGKFWLQTVKKGKGPAVSGPDDPKWPVSGPETYNYVQPTNKYFARRHNARRERGEGQKGTTKSKQQATVYGKFNDDAAYEGPNMFSAYIRVMTDENVMEALQCLEYEDGAAYVTISYKPHQEANSSTKIKLYNVPRDTEVGGMALAFDSLLRKAQQTLLKAGKLEVNQVDEIPTFIITFRQQRKGKNRTKKDRMLSLNKVPSYKG